MPYEWSPVNKAQIADEAAINALGAAVTNHDAVLVDAAPWTSYVPAWTNTGTANTPGGAVFTGKYRHLGSNTVAVRIFLQWDGTTAAGSLIWRFSLPFRPVTTGEILLVMARDQSSGNIFPCLARLSSTVDVVDIGTPTGALISGGTVPFTWANGDQLTIQGIYETSG